MSAIDTATRVINWAISGDHLPPQGDLSATEQLASPPLPLREALAQLVALTAARLRLGAPPLDDGSTVGCDTIVMAAAIGVASVPEAARVVLSAVTMAGSPVEWVACHGLVKPALRFLPSEIANDCRERSPLTALLDRPAPGREDIALLAARRMRSHRFGRLALTLHLAQPVQDVDVRLWRQDLLERLRLEDPDFVLDVFEAMMIHHHQEALAQARSARAVITNPLAATNDALLRDALSIADWWSPLWALERTSVDMLRARRYLGYQYREGIALYQLAQKLRG